MNRVTPAAALIAAALTSSSMAGFLGLTAEYQTVDIGGTPHAIIEVFAQFDVSTNTVLNLFNMKVSFTGAAASVHQNAFVPKTWNPNYSLPSNDQNPADSLVRIGGSLGSGIVASNTTQPDPNWSICCGNWNTAEMPTNVGWFNSNPINLQGQAGADLKTPVSRHVFPLTGPVALNVSGQLAFSIGTPTSQFATFATTFEIAPEPGASDCTEALPLTPGIPAAFDSTGATTDGPTSCGVGYGNDVWFTFTAPITGWASVSTCDSSFESVIAVFEGCDCPVDQASSVGCSFCCCGPMGTTTTFAATAGACYLIQLGGEGGGTGTGTIVVQQDQSDCDGDGIQDSYAVQQGLVADCDFNGQPDACQLAFGDGNGNGVLDICETLPTVIVGPIANPATCRRYALLAESNWTLSQQAAEALGGTLVVIDDAAENAWVWETFSPFSPYLWIGLSDATSRGQFEWVDGTPLGYTSWGPGEPNNYGGNEHYVHQWNAGFPGAWNDRVNSPYFGRGVVELPSGPDLNGDGLVDGADLGQLLAAWGTADPAADLDCSGTVDGADLGLLLSAWSS